MYRGSDFMHTHTRVHTTSISKPLIQQTIQDHMYITSFVQLTAVGSCVSHKYSHIISVYTRSVYFSFEFLYVICEFVGHAYTGSIQYRCIPARNKLQQIGNGFFNTGDCNVLYKSMHCIESQLLHFVNERPGLICREQLYNLNCIISYKICNISATKRAFIPVFSHPNILLNMIR